MADNRFKVMAVGTFKESAVDCPVQLKKYQIIYDVVADKTYLRVIFESFSNKKIIGVFLNIDCADIFEQKFAEVEKAAVNVECDKKYSEFGKECPIIIPKGTKTVKAYISRVVFSDMTVWENRDLTFVASVSDLKPYTAIKEKNQLEKELAKRNYNAKYLPVRYEKSWRCTCGHLNGNLNDVCSACGSRASILFNIFDDKNLEIRRKEDTYNEARKFDTSKDYLQASKLYSTILDYKDSKVLFAKALENSQEAIYTSALDTLKTAQKEENFDSAIKSLSSISEYKDSKMQIEKAKEQKNEFIYNQALQRVTKDNVEKSDFDKSISDMQRIPSYKDSSEKIKEIDAQKQAFLDKKEHARKMKKVRNISIVACVIVAIVIAILIPYLVEPNLYTKEITYKEITIGDQSGYCLVKYNENEENVVIPSEYLGKPVLKIGERAFQGKSLKEITIPESVRQIGSDAFAKCKNLNAVYYTDIEKWHKISFGNSNANPLYNAHNLYLNGELLTDLTIPNNVTSIGDYAFINCTCLTSVIISNSVTSLGDFAFSGCSGLTSISIPNSEISIGYKAFNNCRGLTNITIPERITTINDYAFSYCTQLRTVNWDAMMCKISGHGGQPIFEGCSNITTVNIGDKVTTIPSYAFSDCNGLKSMTIGNGVTRIGYGAFSGCSGLTSITISGRVTSIGEYAFSGCSGLTSIYYTGDVAGWCGISGLDNLMSRSRTLYIGGKEVEGDLVIPDGVTSISNYAFFGCNGLTSITIPDSVKSIGDWAFEDCSGLTSIIVDEGNTKYRSVGNCLIATATKTLVLGCKTSVIPTDGSVKSIGDWAFYNCSGLTSITIPDSVTSIGEHAFDGCEGLTSVIIGNSVKSIGYDAFSRCSGLTNITIPDSVTSISDCAFYGCTGLTSVIIGNSVKSIGQQAFYNCSGLTSINFNGTKAQWNAISKGWYWRDNVPSSCKVYCTDGIISIY